MSEVKQYYIGWDVGAWDFKESSDSCDAVVILNAEKVLQGEACRTSLKNIIINSEDVESFLKAIFQLCGEEKSYTDDIKVVIAIDAVLGFSDSFKNLIMNMKSSSAGLNNHKTNPYLYRKTEIFLSERDSTPLSALTHMIGNQATKAMHVIAKFAEKPKKLGIWKSKSGNVTFIETYPSTCRDVYDLECVLHFGELQERKKGDKISKPEYRRRDLSDAYKCARIAYEFENSPSTLHKPKDANTQISNEEGWIWALKNIKNKQHIQ